MVLAVLAPLVGLLVLSTVSVYLQPKFIVDWIAKTYPEVVFSVNTSEMIIALTIDDAPTRLDTPIILDILRENNVKATFFCIGYNIITEDSDREILARMIREGHELGNHMSFDAPSYQLNDTEFTKQLLEVDELLQEVKNTTVPPDNSNNDTKWFRPGHGFFTRKMVQKVQTYGYKTALGDVYPHDPAIAISSINAYYILKRIHPGGIIILHNRHWSVDTIATIVPRLKAMGYTFATLSELIKHDTKPPQSLSVLGIKNELERRPFFQRTHLRLVMGENVTWGEPVNSGWIDIQKRTFTKWCNSHLAERMLKINDLDKDFEDGILLCTLLEQISSKNVGIVNKRAKIRAQKLENTGAALKFLRDEGIKLVAIGPEDITDGRTKLILGLIWTIILRYQISKVAVGVGTTAKQDLLAWVRKQIPEYNITNFKDNWQDGKALCALANSLEPGILDLSQLPHRSPLDNARAGTEAAEKDLGIPPILQPEDLVSPDVDELSVMTYISYFRDYEMEKMKLMEAESLARIPDPLKCIAFGPGLEKAEVGYEAEFTVQLRTAGGKDIKVGGESTVDVQIKTPLNSPPIKAEVTDNGDGTYHVRYTPKAQGKTVINVNVRSKPIQNSPFSVNVDKLGVDAAKSHAYGPGLEGGATKEPTHFTIVANNKKGDPVGSGGDRFDVKITDPYGSEIKSEVVDNKDGTYNVNYKPSDVGNHTISVQHEGKNVADSPYYVKVDTSSSGPDPSKSEAYGPGLQEAIGGEPAHFTIQARNKAGDNLLHGGDAFDVEVLGPDETPVEVRVVDNKDGTYGVTYHPDEPGKYKVDVFLRGNNPLYYDHVGNSPIVVNADVGIDPSKSLVYGPGVEDGVLNTKPAEFFIRPKDKDGKDIDRRNEPEIFDIKVTDQNGDQIDAPITDNGDGTYKVVYEPTGVGRHKVDVRLKGKPVGNTPVSVNVKDGAWYENTHVDSFSFVIRTKTKQNKDKKEGGETFEVKIVHEGSKEEVKNIKIQDIGDGTYVVSYNLPSDGDYKVNVLLNGKHIKGSPWKQSH